MADETTTFGAVKDMFDYMLVEGGQWESDDEPGYEIGFTRVDGSKHVAVPEPMVLTYPWNYGWWARGSHLGRMMMGPNGRRLVATAINERRYHLLLQPVGDEVDVKPEDVKPEGVLVEELVGLLNEMLAGQKKFLASRKFLADKLLMETVFHRAADLPSDLIMDVEEGMASVSMLGVLNTAMERAGEKRKIVATLDDDGRVERVDVDLVPDEVSEVPGRTRYVAVAKALAEEAIADETEVEETGDRTYATVVELFEVMGLEGGSWISLDDPSGLIGFSRPDGSRWVTVRVAVVKATWSSGMREWAKGSRLGQLMITPKGRQEIAGEISEGRLSDLLMPANKERDV